MHVDKKILTWISYSDANSIYNKQSNNRAEELFKRAEKHLNSDKTKDGRMDAMLTVKRSLNHRLKSIEEKYNFKKVDFPNKPKSYLDLLEKIGIVRPLILKKLLTIRNEIEHNDAPPPSFNQCSEYIDVLWYFLQSTTRFLSGNLETLTYEKNSPSGEITQYFIEFKFNDDMTKANIRGWIPQSYTKTSPKNKNNYFLVKIQECETCAKRYPTKKLLKEHGHEDKLPTDIYFIGDTNIEIDIRLSLIKEILGT